MRLNIFILALIAFSLNFAFGAELVGDDPEIEEIDDLYSEIEVLLDHKYDRDAIASLVERIDDMRQRKYTGLCFEAAIKRLRFDCEKLQISTRSKILFAIELATCELESANIILPKECNLSHTESNNSDTRPCIEYLSQSPQLWTSYTGNFREVISMCFAFQYQSHYLNLEKLQIRTAKFQLSNFALLLNYNKIFRQWQEEDSESFKTLRTEQEHIIDHAKETKTLVEDTKHTLANIGEFMNHLAVALNKSLSIQEAARGSIDQIKFNASALEKDLDTQIENFVTRIDTVIESVYNISKVLDVITDKGDSISSALTYNQDKISVLLEEVAKQVDSVAKVTKDVSLNVFKSLDSSRDAIEEHNNILTIYKENFKKDLDIYFETSTKASDKMKLLTKNLQEATELQRSQREEISETMNLISSHYENSFLQLKSMNDGLGAAVEESNEKIRELSSNIIIASKQYASTLQWVAPFAAYINIAKNFSGLIYKIILFVLITRMNTIFKPLFESTFASGLSVAALAFISGILSLNYKMSILLIFLLDFTILEVPRLLKSGKRSNLGLFSSKPLLRNYKKDESLLRSHEFLLLCARKEPLKYTRNSIPRLI